MRKWLIVVLALLVMLAVGVQAQDDTVIQIPAALETEDSPGGGATAPAIWIHPTDPALSLIIGTDENDGLGVYDLSGALVQFIEEGPMKNVDLRYRFLLGGEAITLLAAGLEDKPTIILYTINAETRQVEELSRLDIGVPHNGLCMYRSALTDTFYLFVVSEAGDVEQHALVDDGNGQITSTVARAFSVGGETEGCVADDELGRLYLGEEAVGLWRYGAEPERGTNRQLVDLVEQGNITEELEGLTLYTAANGAGYLIAANEKNHSFLVYERGGENAFIGEFALGDGPTGVDRVGEPNGMDVVNVRLGDAFPQGLFVTSDDLNSEQGRRGENNFKIASWGEIASALNLMVDTVYDLIGADPAEMAAVGAVTASMETVPVPSGVDAADDPAIWIHPTDTAQSLIIGSDKTSGLVVYNLDGSIQQRLDIGRLNNVDLRYNFPLGGERVALVTATNRTLNSFAVFRINAETRMLEDVAARDFISDVQEVYGICMYISPVTGEYYVIPNSTDGQVEQYRVFDNGEGRVEAELVRTLRLDSQPEGCVVDDVNQIMYIGEETRGIWKFEAEPDGSSEPMALIAETDGNPLTADVEGLTLYLTADGGGYLIASSQGSSEYIVYERGGENAYVGTFFVVESDTVDGVSGTDGIDVTNFPLGETFPNGVFIAQDDLNINPPDNQNFKAVDWVQIAEALGLTVDTSYDPRTLGAE
ncbi:MAG: phytase [Anaerolineae bacterium]